MPDARSTAATARRRVATTLFLLAGVAAGAAMALAGDGQSHRVTQRGRAFAPAIVSMQAGEAIEIVNDDGELVHHAYLDSPAFSFDTGEQAPGSKTLVAFPRRGQFTVLCGIHPKMKLTVSVK